jgi:hypothetical protein
MMTTDFLERLAELTRQSAPHVHKRRAAAARAKRRKAAKRAGDPIPDSACPVENASGRDPGDAAAAGRPGAGPENGA